MRNEQKIKVLMAITKANWGGAQRYVFDVALAAKAAHFDVAVAYGGNGALEDRLKAEHVRTIPFSNLRNEASLLAIIRAERMLRALFKAERPDVVHLNSSLVGIAGALAARRAGVKNIIFTDHGWAFKEWRSLPARAAIWLISWFTVLLANRVIAVSDYELALTNQMPFVGKKAIRIYNGIDLQMVFGTGEKIRVAFPKDAKITGTVGELTKNKNQVALIKEARKDPHMYVAIVGDGQLRGTLEEKIKEYGLEARVKLFGFIPAAEVLKGFDVFALPSIKEALGYVILEARVAGLPIVASRVGGIGEALDKPLSEFSKEKMVSSTLALYIQ